MQEANLAGNSVEECVYNPLREPPLLVLIHLDHLAPVSRDFGQVQALAQVHKVENILLEA